MIKSDKEIGMSDYLLIILAGFLLFFAYKIGQSNSPVFNTSDLVQAMGTLGWVAIGLMCFVIFGVTMLRYL